jgi:hypothetical protein
MTEVDRAREKGETDGFMKVLVDAETLSIAAMRVGTSDRSPVAVHRCHATPSQCSIVSLDWPFDNLGFLIEKFRQILFYVVRS